MMGGRALTLPTSSARRQLIPMTTKGAPGANAERCISPRKEQGLPKPPRTGSCARIQAEASFGHMRTAAPSQKPRAIRVAPGRVLKATRVFDTYWLFAARRQALFMRRVVGEPPPWTEDPVLAAHRFTNAYRAADRVSQYLIRHVLYEGKQADEEIFFRALLFKLFNRIETWEALTGAVGPISWNTFEFGRYARVLDGLMMRRERVYSAAYIMPSPSFGCARKHRNHLRLLEHMMHDGAPARVKKAQSLEGVYQILRSYPSLGDFLAFQFTIDLNYSAMVNFSEMEFVVAGPGAKDGIRKCFLDTAGLAEADVIHAVAELCEGEFTRLGVQFQDLWGRSLKLIDCQNLFCEVDKYSRVVHPEFSGQSGRTRIKQRYSPRSEPLPQWYPPKWNLRPPPQATRSSSSQRGTRRSTCQLPLMLQVPLRTE